ncbi:hypothetical protein J3F84DRAFT_355826 [Trichoderma pleuroticola]
MSLHEQCGDEASVGITRLDLRRSARLAGIRVAFWRDALGQNRRGICPAPHVSVDLVLVSAAMGSGGHT